MKRRLLKTILYRVSASIIAQISSWLIFQKVEVNAGVLLADLIQTAYYYYYEGVWKNK